ncbi:MAG: citramalate synthase, partial [Gammaproteobacteria bacterium]|nr:citramalate synthase [Gammaproteobacteria bacterium]
MKIIIYDTTLRDGAQSEGISFSVQDRADILRELDGFGVDYVECGWPGSNPMTDEFFAIAKDMDLKNAKVTAFGSTRRRDIKAEDDANLKALVSSGAEWACIFGKTWDFQVVHALNTTKEENLAMIGDSVRFLRESGMRVMF